MVCVLMGFHVHRWEFLFSAFWRFQKMVGEECQVPRLVPHLDLGSQHEKL